MKGAVCLSPASSPSATWSVPRSWSKRHKTTTPLYPPDSLPPLVPMNPQQKLNEVPILLGTPTLGLIRIEWHNAIQSLVIPPNFSMVRSTPVGFHVDDAQNMLVDHVLRGRFRFLVLLEDDNVPKHPGFLLALDRHMWRAERKQGPPIVSGLYYIKGSAEVRQGKHKGIELLGKEPLVYRGGGQRAFRDWKLGDVVWVDGVPTGCLMIHRSILEAYAAEPDIEEYSVIGYPHPIKRIFRRPAEVWTDDAGHLHTAGGTSDLYFSEQVIVRGILKKAGYPRFQAKRYPYVIDTSPEMCFDHIDRATGERW